MKGEARALSHIQDLHATLVEAKPFRSAPPWWEWWEATKADGLMQTDTRELFEIAGVISRMAGDIAKCIARSRAHRFLGGHGRFYADNPDGACFAWMRPLPVLRSRRQEAGAGRPSGPPFF